MALFDFLTSQPAYTPALLTEDQLPQGAVPLTQGALTPEALMPSPEVFEQTYAQNLASRQAELERLERLKGVLGVTQAPGMLSPSDIGRAVAPDVGRAPSMSTFALPQTVGRGRFSPTTAASDAGLDSLQAAIGMADGSGNLQGDASAILGNQATGRGYSAGAALADIGTIGVNRAFLGAGQQSAGALGQGMQGAAGQLGAAQSMLAANARANAARQGNAAQAAAAGVGGPAGAAARLQASNQGAIARAGAGGEVNRQMAAHALARQAAEQRAGLLAGHMQGQASADAAAARQQMGLAASQLEISDQLAALGLLPGAVAAQRAGDQGVAAANVGMGQVAVGQDAMALGAAQTWARDQARSDEALAGARLDALGLNANQVLARNRLGVGFDALGSEAAQQADRINMGIARDVGLHNIGQGQQFRQGEARGMLTVNDMLTGQGNVEYDNQRTLERMRAGGATSYQDRVANVGTGNAVRAARRYADGVGSSMTQTGALLSGLGTAAAAGVAAAGNQQQSSAAGWKEGRS